MRSGISCFNSTLYRKTMGRFWPLWVSYGLIWLFTLPLNLMNQYFNMIRSGMLLSDAQSELLRAARDIPEFLSGGVSLSLVSGLLCAMAVFGYLYSSRSSCMMHALPLRRETLFSTQYLAGLSFLLLPHLVVGALTLVVELTLLPSALWGDALPALGVWLLVQSGTALFFFSFAAFCAMFTGHALALPAFYSILNVLVMVIHLLISQLMSQFFYGYPGGRAGGALVRYCTPSWALTDACHVGNFYSTSSLIVANSHNSAAEASYGLYSPGTVAAYAAAGLVFALLALLVYHCRHVESAGDVVAIPLVRPLFKYGVSFCSGLCFGTFTAAFFNWGNFALSLCVLFWAAVGYFAAEMLLQKTFRVLRAWKGCVVMTVVLALLCLTFFLDLFGIETRVPEADQISSLYVYGDMAYPYDSGNHLRLRITDPDQIQQILDLHQAIVQNRDRRFGPAESYLSFEVSYALKNGFTLERRYYSIPIDSAELDQPGSVTWQTNQLLQNRALVAMSYGFSNYERGRLVEAYLDNAYSLSSNSLTTQYLDGAIGEDLENLWKAMRQDFDEGNIGVRYLFDDKERRTNTYYTDLGFTWEISDPSRYPGPAAANTTTITITLTPQAKHTLAVLKESGALGTSYILQPHTYDEPDPVQKDTELPAVPSF